MTGVVTAIMCLIGLVFGLTNFGGETGRQISEVLLLATAALAGGGFTTAALYHAATRNLISVHSTAGCVASGLLLCGVVWSVVPGSPDWKFIWSAFALLAVAPFPAVPTAISWNRHR